MAVFVSQIFQMKITPDHGWPHVHMAPGLQGGKSPWIGKGGSLKDWQNLIHLVVFGWHWFVLVEFYSPIDYCS